VPDIGFCGPMYESRSRAVNAQECINFYPELARTVVDWPSHQFPDRQKAELVLYSTPGLRLFCTLPNNKAVRGSFVTSNNRMFYVAGNKLYEVSQYGKVTEWGTIEDSGNTRVNFADNGIGVDQPILDANGNPTGEYQGLGMMFVDGFNGYMFNLTTNTLAKITGGYFPTIMTGYTEPQYGYFPQCTHVCFLGGKFIVNELNSQRFYWSNLYDGFHWDPLNYSSAETLPDNISALASLNGDLWIIGTQSIEVWKDSGSSSISYSSSAIPTAGAFSLIHGGVTSNGTIAPNSVVSNGQYLFWLGSSTQGHGQVWMTQNYSPIKCSTTSIDFITEGLPDIKDAIGYTYTQSGHQFYILSFINGNRTLVYDANLAVSNQIGMWHERGAWNQNTGVMDRHYANSYVFFLDKVYCGDYRNGNVYILDDSYYLDNGEIVRRVRTGSHVHQDRKRLFFNMVEVDFERGVGNPHPVSPTDQSYDPQAMLSYSDDGGFTFKNEIWKKMGKAGAYRERLKFTRLGNSRDRVFRITVSDPNKVVLISAVADITAEK